MDINKPGDIAALGLSLAEAKLLLAEVRREIVAAQTKAHAARIRALTPARRTRLILVVERR